MNPWIRRLSPWGRIIELVLFGAALFLVIALPLNELNGPPLLLALCLNGVLLVMAIRIVWQAIEAALEILGS